MQTKNNAALYAGFKINILLNQEGNVALISQKIWVLVPAYH